MQNSRRLQPVEIHPKLKSVVDRWQEHSSDTSVSKAFHNDGKELGPLNVELSQANIAWSMSAILDELAARPDIMNILRPPPKDIPSDAFFLMNAEALKSNSVFFRTYVSVVLGRTEKFVDAINHIAKRNPSKHFSATLKMLRSDEVRHLRNAIGHGTFVARGQVMIYRDGTHERRISFRELDIVNSAIWAIILAGLTGSYAWKEELKKGAG